MQLLHNPVFGRDALNTSNINYDEAHLFGQSSKEERRRNIDRERVIDRANVRFVSAASRGSHSGLTNTNVVAALQPASSQIYYLYFSPLQPPNIPFIAISVDPIKGTPPLKKNVFFRALPE